MASFSGIGKIKKIAPLILLLSFIPGAQTPAEQLSLDECIDIARRENLDIRSALNTYESARENVWGSWSGLLPTLSSYMAGSRTIYGPTKYLRWDQATNQFINASTGISVSENYSAGFSLSQTLFDGGSNIYDILDARAAAGAKKYGYISTEKDIIYQVKEKYYSLLKAKMLVDVSKEAVKRGEQQLKIAQSRYDLGSASLSDVLKARVQYGNDKLDQVEAENNYKLAMADLNYIMNRDVNLFVEPVEEFSIREVDYDQDSALQTALARHPGLLEAEQNLKSAQYQKLSARGMWLPSFSIRASYGWNDQDLGNISDFTEENYTWSLTGNLSFTIFNGFQRKSWYNQSRIAYRTAEDSYYSARNGVALEIKQAFLNIEKARENLDLTKESEEAAREDFNLAQEKYNLGAATILDLIDAQVSFKQAEANRIQALFDYNLAVSHLEKAMGL
jgi:outer membrane protein